MPIRSRCRLHPKESLFRLFRRDEFCGTAVLASERHLLTCAHLVKHHRRFEGRSDGSLGGAGTVIGNSAEDYLALLELDIVCHDPPLWLPCVSSEAQVMLWGFPCAAGVQRALRKVPARPNLEHLRTQAKTLLLSPRKAIRKQLELL